MTEIESRPVEVGYDRDAGVSDRLLWARLARTSNRADFAAVWLQLQARLLKDVRVGVLILGEAEQGPFMPVGLFPPRAAISPDLSVAAETALADRKGAVCDRPAGERSEASQCVALPILIDDELHGVVAFDLLPRSAEALAEAGRRLQWGVAWIEVLIRRQTLLPNSQLVEIMDMVATVMEAPSLSVALQSLAVELARVLEAEWAACGLVRRNAHVDVEAISQAVTTSRRPALIGAVQTAMQEAFDQRSLVEIPEDREAFPVVTRAHRLLAEATSADGVMTIPIARHDSILGILTVAARAGRQLSTRDRDFCRLLASMVGPALDLKLRDDRWIGAKIGASLHELLARLVGPRHTLLKLGAVAVVAAAAYLSLGTATYRVTAQATVEGSVQRAVAAPIAGYIAAQGPRAGDSVAKGEVLARLDDREFQVERARWLSEREQRLREYQQAFAGGDRSRVQVLKAEIEQSQAHIDLLDQQIARVELRAPIDGVIVRGDLSQMIGAPVQRGEVLFEIAPLADYRIILKVDERDMAAVRQGQAGELILSSLSSLAFPIRVTKLTPVSTSEEGRNVFRVEAAFDEADPAIRPGMQGYGKIEIGERNVAAIATARLLQWLRMTIWRFQW